MSQRAAIRRRRHAICDRRGKDVHPRQRGAVTASLGSVFKRRRMRRGG